MPTEEFTYTRAQMGVFAHEAHLLRTRDRLNVWKRRFEQPTGPQDRTLAELEIKLLERQLHEPYTERALAATAESKTTTPQKLPEVFAQMFQNLQTEIVELKQRLSGRKETSDGALPVGEVTSASASAPS